MRKWLIWFTHPVHGQLLRDIQRETQGRNSEAGIDAEARKECCFLVHSPWLAQFAFFIHPRNIYPGYSSIHSGLGPSISIINRENSPQTCLQAGHRFSCGFFSFHMTLACSHSTNTNQHIHYLLCCIKRLRNSTMELFTMRLFMMQTQKHSVTGEELRCRFLTKDRLGLCSSCWQVIYFILDLNTLFIQCILCIILLADSHIC